MGHLQTRDRHAIVRSPPLLLVLATTVNVSRAPTRNYVASGNCPLESLHEISVRIGVRACVTRTSARGILFLGSLVLAPCIDPGGYDKSPRRFGNGIQYNDGDGDGHGHNMHACRW